MSLKNGSVSHVLQYMQVLYKEIVKREAILFKSSLVQETHRSEVELKKVRAQIEELTVFFPYFSLAHSICVTFW